MNFGLQAISASAWSRYTAFNAIRYNTLFLDGDRYRDELARGLVTFTRYWYVCNFTDVCL
jgi:hypothetical protein